MTRIAALEHVAALARYHLIDRRGPFRVVPEDLRIAFHDLDTSSAQSPLFAGTVRDAGGGEVVILVDRDTMQYPVVGQRVSVIAA